MKDVIDINKIAKEFYAQYGLAMHTVQTIENGLLILYALWVYSEKNISKIDYLKIRAKQLTLGNLKDKMLDCKIFDESARVELTKVNNIRRFLAHNYWWERDIIFNNKIQLHSLYSEIITFINIFEQLINVINFKINTLRKGKNIYIEEEFGLHTVSEIRNYISNLKNKTS